MRIWGAGSRDALGNWSILGIHVAKFVELIHVFLQRIELPQDICEIVTLLGTMYRLSHKWKWSINDEVAWQEDICMKLPTLLKHRLPADLFHYFHILFYESTWELLNSNIKDFPALFDCSAIEAVGHTGLDKRNGPPAKILDHFQYSKLQKVNGIWIWLRYGHKRQYLIAPPLFLITILHLSCTEQTSLCKKLKSMFFTIS